jgi:hypothetical protein
MQWPFIAQALIIYMEAVFIRYINHDDCLYNIFLPLQEQNILLRIETLAITTIRQSYDPYMITIIFPYQ